MTAKRFWIWGGIVLGAIVTVYLGNSFESRLLDSERAEESVQVSGSGSSDSSLSATSSKTRSFAKSGLVVRKLHSILSALRRELRMPGAIQNEAVLRFKSAAALREFLQRAKLNGVQVKGQLDRLNTLRVRFDRLDQLAKAVGDGADLAEDPGANFIVEVPRPLDIENRPEGSGSAPFEGTSYLQAIGASGDRSGWGQGVTVAIVDTGVENHPTFTDGQVTHVDLVNDGKAFNGHGTAMASLVGGNDPQAPGVAPAAHILDIRIADSQGIGQSFTLADGIVRAADMGAKIINVSFGSYGNSSAVSEAVNYANSQGSVVLAAAGNDATSNQLAYPAALSSVISVGGVDAHMQQAYFSNSGSGLDVTAPAVGIQSAWSHNTLALGDGTSEATAIASGVAAYAVWSRQTTAGGVSTWITSTALRLALSPDRGGAGMVRIRPR